MHTVRSLQLAVAIGLAFLPATAEAQMAPKIDLEDLAQTLVVENAAVREGDKVLITGGVRDIELLENLAIEVRTIGAHPLIVIDSERLAKRMFDDVPEIYDAQSPDLDLALAEIFTVEINVPINPPPELLAHVNPTRFATRAAAFEPVTRRNRERGLRFVELGNGLYPTAWRAERFGIGEKELADLFWSGVNVDDAGLQTAGEGLRARLASGQEVRITHPDGTDLSMRIAGRPVYVSDGVVSAEDEAKGGAATQVWLPAGEVYFTPVPGSAMGTVVMDRDYYQDQEIRNLRLSFADGKLVSMTADSGLEPLQAFFDASGAGKDALGLVDIGINPNIRIPAGSRVESYSPAGIVTIGFGNNTWAGGENVSNFSYNGFLTGATVTVDGAPIVENGEIRP